MSTTTPLRDDGAVAAYASLEGAERAVSHLVSLGYDEHDVGIGPRDFDVADPHPVRRSLRAGARRGGIVGLAAMAVIGVWWEVGTAAVTDTILPLVAIGGAAGLLTGIVVAAIAYRRRRARAFGPAPEALVPTRYEVVVERDRDRARHGLARWWDPAAPPARWQQPA